MAIGTTVFSKDTGTYQQAMIDYQAKQYQQAVQGFYQIADYRDSLNLAVKAETEMIQSANIADTVYFGYRDGSPVQWNLIGKNDQQYLLLSQNIIATSFYGETTDYHSSAVKTVLDDYYTTTFNELEKQYMNSGEDGNLFLLNRNQFETYVTYDFIQKSTSGYWLSDVTEEGNILVVNSQGQIVDVGNDIQMATGIRCAVWLTIKD